MLFFGNLSKLVLSFYYLHIFVLKIIFGTKKGTCVLLFTGAGYNYLLDIKLPTFQFVLQTIAFNSMKYAVCGS
jgi:hypothetical protein